MYEENETRPPLSLNLDVIDALKKNKIVKIERTYNELSIERYKKKVDENNLFNFLPGAILFHLGNGDVVGFKGEAIFDSVVAWFDLKDGKEDWTCYYQKDWSEHIPNDDPLYTNDGEWDHMIGHAILSIKVIVVCPEGKQQYDGFYEKALVFETEGGSMMISYCLLDLPEGAPFPITKPSIISEHMLQNVKVIEL